MSRTSLLSAERLSDDFWEAYQQLWQNSAERSPFEAPQLLRYLAANTSKTVTAFAYYRGDAMRGAVVLKERHKVCTFLSDLKTDVNTFVFAQDCSLAEQRVFFEKLLTVLGSRGWSLELNHYPLQDQFTAALEAAARTRGLHWTLVPHSVCPLLTAENPSKLEEYLRKNQRYRYYAHRLGTQFGAVFRAQLDAGDLEAWVLSYCNAHIQRWANTPTPSAFREAKRRAFLLGCLRAWHQDLLLVRFSLHLPDNKPIAFALGLLQPPALIFHATTFDPTFARYSPGKALIFHIGAWMAQNHLSVLDFGDGNEPYKYDVATTERSLCRVFICSPRHLRCRTKARSFQWLKAHPQVERLYRFNIKPWAAKIAIFLHAMREMLEALLAGI